MSNKLVFFLALLLLASSPASAGRALDDAERTQLQSALDAQGCSGGKFEFDDGRYEVEGAKCGDGNIYELKFDAAFKLIEKKLDR